MAGLHQQSDTPTGDGVGSEFAALRTPGGQPASPEARQRAALAAVSRLATTVRSDDRLIGYALGLLHEVLQADYAVHTEYVPDERRWRSQLHPAQGGQPVVHEENPEPTTVVGHAVDLGAPVRFEDLRRDTRFNDVFLRGMNVISGVVAPLRGDEVRELLAAYRTGGQPFSHGDLEFLETLAHLLAVTAARNKAECELTERETLDRVIVDSLPSPVVTVDYSGRIESVNLACVEMTGRSEKELQRQLFWQAFAGAGEQKAISTAFVESRGARGIQMFQTQPGSGDRRRTIAWRMINNFHPGGGVASVTLIGEDLTQTLALQDEVDRLRRASLQQGAAETAGRGYVPSIEETIKPPPGATGAERRTSPRISFPYTQRIAPMAGGAIPKKSQFFEVRCRDISAGGIAFVMDDRPDFQSLVVALGQPPGESFFTARVVRVTEIREDDRDWVLVGCRFTGRVHL